MSSKAPHLIPAAPLAVPPAFRQVIPLARPAARLTSNSFLARWRHPVVSSSIGRGTPGVAGNQRPDSHDEHDHGDSDEDPLRRPRCRRDPTWLLLDRRCDIWAQRRQVSLPRQGGAARVVLEPPVVPPWKDEIARPRLPVPVHGGEGCPVGTAMHDDLLVELRTLPDLLDLHQRGSTGVVDGEDLTDEDDLGLGDLGRQGTIVADAARRG